MKFKSEPAFPALQTMGVGGIFQGGPGLTKREYFAGLAMQGFCSNYAYLCEKDKKALDAKTGLEKVIATASVAYADALIAELGEP